MLPAFLSAGVTGIFINSIVPIIGGTPVAQLNGLTAIAFENVGTVLLPAALPLFVSALVGFGFVARRKRKAQAA